MPTRRPLALVGGNPAELPVGDTIPAAAALLTKVDVSTNYTAASGEYVMADAANGTITITLPATGVAGVKKRDTTANVVTVAASSGRTLGTLGAASLPLRLPDQAMITQVDGTNHVITHGYHSLAQLDRRHAPNAAVWHDFTTKANGALSATIDSGQALSVINAGVTSPSVSGGAAVYTPPSSTGANYALYLNVDLGSTPINRIAVEFDFTGGNDWTLGTILWESPYVGGQSRTPFHFGFTRTGWSCLARTTTGGSFTTVATGNFSVPLVAGVRYTADAYIIGTRAICSLPDGSIITFSSAALASIPCGVACWEPFGQNGSTDGRLRIYRIGADSVSPSVLPPSGGASLERLQALHQALQPVVFQGRSTTSQTLAAADTWYPVALDTEDRDDGNCHSTSANTSRWVAPRTGTAVCVGSVTHGSGTAGAQRVVALYKNGSFVPGAINGCAHVNTSVVTTAPIPTVEVPVVAGDYLELQARVTGAANQTLLATTSNYGSLLRVELRP